MTIAALAAVVFVALLADGLPLTAARRREP